MYELEKYDSEIAAQIYALPLYAFLDFEAATAFIPQRPFEGDLFDTAQPSGSQCRAFAQGMGLILYRIRPDVRRVAYQQVSYLAW